MISNEALAWLAHRGYSPEYGARPLKRLIQNQILNTLSKTLLGGDLDKEKPIVIDVFDDQMVLRAPIEEEAYFEIS